MPQITQLDNDPTPNNNDLLVTVDMAAGTTKNISREQFFTGAPLPANTVNGQAIADGSVTAPKLGVHPFTVNYSFSTGTGTETITGVPFRPYAVIVQSRRVLGAILTGSGHASDTGSGTVQGSQAAAGGGTANATIASTTAAFLSANSAGTVNFRAAVTSWNSDGITVNKLDASTGSSLDWTITFFP